MECHEPVFFRHVICRHRIEVEVTPASAEVCFRNERFAHPLNTKVQFEAVVYNAPTGRVTWQVNGLDGGPARGSIDAEGLYLTPAKATPGYDGFTEVITATSVDDPSRAAFARVTVIGLGPKPRPLPRVEIYPRTAELYYREQHNNDHIDPSNKMQLFRAMLYHADSAVCEWQEDAGPWGQPGPEYLYKPSANYGGLATVHIAVRLQDRPEIQDRATIALLNYEWPGIV